MRQIERSAPDRGTLVQWIPVAVAAIAAIGIRILIDTLQVRDQIAWMRAAGNPIAETYQFDYHVPLLATVAVPALIGGALAWRGRRWWSLLPIAVWVLLPTALAGLGHDQWSPLVWWWSEKLVVPGLFSIRGLSDHALAFGIAALPVIALVRGPFADRRTEDRVPWEIALIAALIFGLYLWVESGLHAGLINSSYPWIALGFVFGAQHGRPNAVFAGALAGTAVMMQPYWSTPDAVTLIAAGFVGSGLATLSPVFNGARDRSLALLIALNVLNVIDAIVTTFLVSTDTASEANPVIEIIGMPGKIVLVGAASYALYRLRPRVMPYLAAALALVVMYQLAGTVGTLLAPA